MKGSVPKETVVLRWWGSEKKKGKLANQTSFLIDQITTIKPGFHQKTNHNESINRKRRDFYSIISFNIIQLSPEAEVNSGRYIPRRKASKYISTALHRP